jgi:thiamine biosynthesis lipoprotein
MTLPSYRTATAAMGTVVTVEVVTAAPSLTVEAALERALHWFAHVERACSRFEPTSELRQLLGQVGRPVVVSPVLCEALRFALALARLTGGAFDPTIGHRLELMGFNRHFVTGATIETPAPIDRDVSYRDVALDPTRRTATLRRPLVLDLGAVAKGLAIDLAARELAVFDNVCVEAGGDLVATGRNAAGQPWQIGIRDPHAPDRLAMVLPVSNRAVCTSGGYERRTPDGREHHLIDPRTGQAAGELASVTVVAPTALAADGLATAAFVLGPRRGLALLEAAGVDGLLITHAGEALTTRGLEGSPA